MTRTRVAALGGVIGPLAFISAWLFGNVAAGPPYSPVDDAISRLAAVGADTQTLMTSGFIVFGVSLPVFAVALRRTVPGPAWITATATGVATLAVAATPLDYSDTVDTLHGLAATVGYVTLAATPWLASTPLRAHGHTLLARAGQIAGTVSALSLAASAVTDANGLFQRIGLTATDAWIVLAATMIAAGHIVSDERAASTAP